MTPSIELACSLQGITLSQDSRGWVAWVPLTWPGDLTTFLKGVGLEAEPGTADPGWHVNLVDAGRVGIRVHPL